MINFRFEVKFFIKRTRLNSQGLTPVNIQVRLDRQSVSFTSGINIDPGQWDPQTHKAIGRTKSAREINNSLTSIHIDLRNLYHKMTMKEDAVSLTKLRDIFLGKDTLEKDYFLIDQFDKLIDQKQLLAKSNIMKEASADSYFCTREKLIDYLESAYRTSDINIKKINPEFVEGFRVYLLSDGGCEHNTMIRHMRRLKQITTNAYRNHYIDSDPFVYLKLSEKAAEISGLTEKELAKLIIQDFQNPVLNKVRDMFLFCCFTGLAYTDLKHLKYSSITDNIIFIDRVKTGNPCFVPLLPIPLALIEKYRNKTEYVFPVKTNKHMNDCLERMKKVCGIRKSLRMHVGRHTFGTLLINKGVPIESISKMLGHSDSKTTRIYAKMLDQEILNEMDQVKAKLRDLTECYIKYNNTHKGKPGKG